MNRKPLDNWRARLDRLMAVRSGPGHEVEGITSTPDQRHILRQVKDLDRIDYVGSFDGMIVVLTGQAEDSLVMPMSVWRELRGAGFVSETGVITDRGQAVLAGGCDLILMPVPGGAGVAVAA